MRAPRTDTEELVAGMRRVIDRGHADLQQGVAGYADAAGRASIELRPPALVRPVVLTVEVAVDEIEFAVEALAVLVLILREPERRLGRRAERGGHPEAGIGRALAALGRVHDRAIRGSGAVQCRGVRALQDSHRRNVVGVDIGRRIADVIAAQRRARRIRAARAVAFVRRRGVVDRHAVDDDERLVLSENRAGPAHDDARRAERVRGVGHLHAGDFALQGRDHVVRADVGQAIAVERLCGVRKTPLLALDAQRGHHNLLQLDRGFLECDVLLHRWTAHRDLHGAGLITDQPCGERQWARRARRQHEAIVASIVGRGLDLERRSTDDHADEWRASHAGLDLTGHRRRFLRSRDGRETEEDEPDC